jgi:5-methylcytosine-specific restriction endonuclease McrA
MRISPGAGGDTKDIMAKLQTLKPRISVVRSSQVQLLQRGPGIERKRGSAGVKDRRKIKERDNGLCVLCLAAGRVSLGAVVDHRVPLWNGGSDEDENKQTLCHLCHDEKTAREAKQRAGAA